MTAISIAMATYNGERHLHAQLESLAAQTLRPLELVVTDDGSTDGTMAIVEKFRRTAPFPVRVFSNKQRLNYTKNFLRAASLCQGDWIAFCDQDDVWLEHKLATVATRIAKHPDAILIKHSGIMTDEELRPVGVRLPNLPDDEVLPPLCERGFGERGFARDSGFMGFAMVFRADILSIAGAIPLPNLPS
jgi:glycosyltransferase involved in cell wall biosynthesis